MNFYSITEEQFWNWFTENQFKLIDSKDADHQNYLDQLLEKLHKYCDRLYYEIGFFDEHTAELIVTANGEQSHFDKVSRLIKSAPKLENWVFTALKPPGEREFEVEFQGVTVNSEKTYFLPLSNPAKPGQLGLEIFVEGYSNKEQEKYFYGVFIALMTLLGEKSAAEDIHYIRVKNLEERAGETYLLTRLPDYMEWYKQKIN